jgi:hypothetical protein
MEHDGVIQVTKSIRGNPIFGRGVPLKPFYPPNPTIFHATIEKESCYLLNSCRNKVAGHGVSDSNGKADVTYGRN